MIGCIDCVGIVLVCGGGDCMCLVCVELVVW